MCKYSYSLQQMQKRWGHSVCYTLTGKSSRFSYILNMIWFERPIIICSDSVEFIHYSSSLPDSFQYGLQIGNRCMFVNIPSVANWRPVGQFSTQCTVLIIRMHVGYACFNIHLCCSSSQRGDRACVLLLVRKISDQLALCLWILWPAEIVCSTPQDVL